MVGDEAALDQLDEAFAGQEPAGIRVGQVRTVLGARYERAQERQVDRTAEQARTGPTDRTGEDARTGEG
jgi:hypothetical protein